MIPLHYAGFDALLTVLWKHAGPISNFICITVLAIRCWLLEGRISKLRERLK